MVLICASSMISRFDLSAQPNRPHKNRQTLTAFNTSQLSNSILRTDTPTTTTTTTTTKKKKHASFHNMRSALRLALHLSVRSVRVSTFTRHLSLGQSGGHHGHHRWRRVGACHARKNCGCTDLSLGTERRDRAVATPRRHTRAHAI